MYLTSDIQQYRQQSQKTHRATQHGTYSTESNCKRILDPLVLEAEWRYWHFISCAKDVTDQVRRIEWLQLYNTVSEPSAFNTDQYGFFPRINTFKNYRENLVKNRPIMPEKLHWNERKCLILCMSWYLPLFSSFKKLHLNFSILQITIFLVQSFCKAYLIHFLTPFFKVTRKIEIKLLR